MDNTTKNRYIILGIGVLIILAILLGKVQDFINQGKTKSENHIIKESQPSDVKKQKSLDSLKAIDDKMYLFLVDYFKERNTTLCFVYYSLCEKEKKSIQLADEKYTMYNKQNINYQEKLYKKAKRDFFKRFNINDSLSAYIYVFGLRYCK